MHECPKYVTTTKGAQSPCFRFPATAPGAGEDLTSRLLRRGRGAAQEGWGAARGRRGRTYHLALARRELGALRLAEQVSPSAQGPLRTQLGEIPNLGGPAYKHTPPSRTPSQGRGPGGADEHNHRDAAAGAEDP